MLLLVGLGNPGSGYSKNRHNIGFMAADEIVRRHSFGPYQSKFQGRLSRGVLAGETVLVLKPETYMNDSGRSVGEACRFFKIPPEDVVVLHDELDLPPGRMRIKKGGGHGGHNGLRSIDAHIGKEYRRIRLGIGHPGDKDRVSGYVLSDFAKGEQDWLEKLIDAVAASVPLLADGKDQNFMNKVALATQPPKKKKPKKDQDDKAEEKDG